MCGCVCEFVRVCGKPDECGTNWCIQMIIFLHNRKFAHFLFYDRAYLIFHRNQIRSMAPYSLFSIGSQNHRTRYVDTILTHWINHHKLTNASFSLFRDAWDLNPVGMWTCIFAHTVCQVQNVSYMNTVGWIMKTFDTCLILISKHVFTALLHIDYF